MLKQAKGQRSSSVFFKANMETRFKLVSSEGTTGLQDQNQTSKQLLPPVSTVVEGPSVWQLKSPRTMIPNRTGQNEKNWGAATVQSLEPEPWDSDHLGLRPLWDSVRKDTWRPLGATHQVDAGGDDVVHLTAAGQALVQRHLVEVEGRVQTVLTHLQLVSQSVDVVLSWGDSLTRCP